METANVKEKYFAVRKQTESLCLPLETEDYLVQPAEDISPPKWHLGHTTWFFEVFILEPHKKNYKVFNKHYNFIFNSYYEHMGPRVIRADRGNLSRPSVEDVYKYRQYIDNEMAEFMENAVPDDILKLIVLGLNHEQQHQELLITDIKYIFGHNPLFPAYLKESSINRHSDVNLSEDYTEIPEGIYEAGYYGSGFCYDNELARHRVFLHPYKFLNRLVTNGEYLEFIEVEAYNKFDFWLSDGWDMITETGIKAPMYWHKIGGEWYNYTTGGLKKINPAEPVTHVSYYEAEAFARWKGKRLLTEFEWEIAAEIYEPQIIPSSNFADSGLLHPVPRRGNSFQFLGDVWEWTGSAYLPYPYYKQDKGALGEYNGKFMSGQMVLRGGSCATPRDHIRNSYRNFFQPEKRWQFKGFRLAESI